MSSAVPLEMIIDSVLRGILSPYFVWPYCGVIVGFFLYRALPLRHKARRLQSTMENASRQITGTGERKFRGNFDAYNREMEKQFQTPWKEFVETLDIQEHEPSAPIRNTQPVSRYLNHSSIILPAISFDLYRSVPNLLTGFGILGTFIGLAAGVYAAGDGLSSSGNPEQINQSLRQLLQGASLAFVTSIFGIASSMAFLGFERRCHRKLQRALDSWVLAIESCVRRVTSEGVALRQLEHARRATVQLENFNTNLVFALEQALEEKVAARLSPQLDRLVEAVQELRVDRSTDAATMIAKVANQFAEAMKSRTGTEFEEMATEISGLTGTLRKVSDQMEAAQRDTQAALSTTVKSVKESMGASTSTMTDALQQALGAFTQAMEERTGAKFDEMAATISGLNRAIQGSTETMERTQSDIRRALEQIVSSVKGSMGDSVNEIAEAWRLALDQFTNAMTERAGVEFDEMAQTIGKLNGTLTDATHGMAKSQQELRAALDRIAASVSASMENGAGAVTATLRELLGQITAMMESAAEHFTTRLASASGDAATALSAAANSLTTAAAEASSQITGSMSGLRGAVKSLEGSTGQSKRVLDSMTAFAAQTDALRSVIELAHRRISDAAAPIALAATAMKEASGATAAALNDTRAVAGGIGASVATLADHEGRMADAWAKYQNRFEYIDESLVTLFRELDAGLARYCEQVKNFANELDDKTARVMRVLAGAVHEFHEAVEAEYQGRRRR